MTHQEFILKAKGWGEERGLYSNSTLEAQEGMYLEEVGELQRGINKSNIDLIKDSIGDIVVVLTHICVFDKTLEELLNCSGYLEKVSLVESMKSIVHSFSTSQYSPFFIMSDLENIASIYDISMSDCYERAWNDIKDRKGKFIGGVYVKEADYQ